MLTDFPSYPGLNPFIRWAKGEARAGARLQVHLQPPGARGITFRPRVPRAEENRELRWLGHLGIPGLFDGEHIFTIEALGGDRVRLIQRETFRGLLVPVFARGLDRNTLHRFEEMNQALKLRAERGSLHPLP